MCVPPYKFTHVRTYIEHIHTQNGSLFIWNSNSTGKPDWFGGLEQGTIWLHDTDPHPTFLHNTIQTFHYPIKSPSHQLATRPLLINVHLSQGFVRKESWHQVVNDQPSALCVCVCVCMVSCMCCVHVDVDACTHVHICRNQTKTPSFSLEHSPAYHLETAWVDRHAWPCLIFMWVLGIPNQFFMLAPQATSPGTSVWSRFTLLKYNYTCHSDGLQLWTLRLGRKGGNLTTDGENFSPWKHNDLTISEDWMSPGIFVLCS